MDLAFGIVLVCQLLEVAIAAVKTTPKAVNTTGDFTVRCTGTPPDGDFLKFDWPQDCDSDTYTLSPQTPTGAMATGGVQLNLTIHQPCVFPYQYNICCTNVNVTAGTNSTTCSLINVQGLLQPPTDLNSRCDAEGIHFMWVAPQTLNLTDIEPDIDNYTLHITILDTMRNRTVTITDTEYTLTSVDGVSEYQFSVSAWNVVGEGNRSEPMKGDCDNEGDSSGHLSTGIAIAIALGVLAILAILYQP